MSDDTIQNNQLRELLMPLSKVSPEPELLSQWHASVQAELSSSPRNARSAKFRWVPTTARVWGAQIAAAVIVGVVVGATLVSSAQPDRPASLANYSIDDATFERSHANLD